MAEEEFVGRKWRLEKPAIRIVVEHRHRNLEIRKSVGGRSNALNELRAYREQLLQARGTKIASPAVRDRVSYGVTRADTLLDFGIGSNKGGERPIPVRIEAIE